MYGEHWSDDDLIARLYGVKSEDPHIGNCTTCAARWEAVLRRHEKLRRNEVEVPDVFLAAQRRAVEARLGAKRFPLRIALVPIMAALVIGIGIVAMRPIHDKQPPVEQISDTQLFEDVFSRLSAGEPSSVGPIHSLFEEQK
jgi:hypothetical protein